MQLNFRKNAQVFLVHNNKSYLLDVGPEIAFSQTFSENTTSVKTLHQELFFERSTISKANPANFQFTVPLLQEDDLKIVFERLIAADTFELYIKSNESTFKLETCIITEGTFVIERLTNLKLNISGQAAKLSRVGDNSYTIPGVSQTRSSTRNFLINNTNTITLGGSDISTELYNISASLQNSIEWTQYETVHSGLNVSDSSNAMFPKSFSISKKVFSGSLGYYLVDGSNSNFLNFSTNTSLRIQAGESIGGNFYGLDFNMPNCSFTNRSTAAEIFTQHFDWRLTNNGNLPGIIFYNTV